MGNLKLMAKKDYCEFCDIINNNKELLIYEDEKIIAFHDIDKASAAEHILVCPKEHIADVGSLTLKDIPLIQKMQEIGEKILEKLKPGASFR